MQTLSLMKRRIKVGFAAAILIAGQVMMPIPRALAEDINPISPPAPLDNGLLLPVWCKYIAQGGWIAMLSDNSAGTDGPLNGPVVDYTTNANNQVLAHDRSDKLDAACAAQYTLTLPSQADVCGTNNDTFSYANMTITADTGWSGNARTITFTAVSPYRFAEGATTYTHTYTDEATTCPGTPIAVPAAPSVTDMCGLNNATWNIPANTTEIHWALVNGELHAYAQPDYVFSTGDPYDHNYGPAFDSGRLCTAAMPNFSSTPVCGANNDIVKLVDADSVYYTYTVNTWSGNQLSITVTADANYDFGDGITEYTVWFTDGNTRCISAPLVPTFTNMTCTADSSYTIPDDTAHYYTVQVGLASEEEAPAGAYPISTLGQTVTIRAYYLEELSGTWQNTFTVPDCRLGKGNTTPPPQVQQVQVQELPKTGPGDNSYLTVLGLVASFATYGAVLSLQRRNS